MFLSVFAAVFSDLFAFFAHNFYFNGLFGFKHHRSEIVRELGFIEDARPSIIFFEGRRLMKLIIYLIMNAFERMMYGEFLFDLMEVDGFISIVPIFFMLALIGNLEDAAHAVV